MKKYILPILICAALAIPSFAQESENDSTIINSDSLLNAGLDQLLSYMLFTRDDFTFRDDYMPRDPYRLKIVDSLMKHPLLMDDFADSCAVELSRFFEEPNECINYLDILQGDRHPPGLERYIARCGYGTPPGPYPSEELSKRLRDVTGSFKWKYSYMLQQFHIYIDCWPEVFPTVVGYDKEFRQGATVIPDDKKSEIFKFVFRDYKELILDYPDYRVHSNEKLDSLQQLEEEFAKEFVQLSDNIIDTDISGFPPKLLNSLDTIYKLLAEDSMSYQETFNKVKSEPYSWFTDFGRLAIGTSGNDTYTGDYFMIIDPGGDDVYNISYDIENPHPTLIVDYSGNDIYKAETDFALASGALSYSLLIDYEGDDIYWGKNFSLGSGYFGVGILWDKKGNDKYFGDTFVQGAGTFGLGLLIDEDGSDTYTCHFQSQGFGFVRGIGGIADYAGNDAYIVQPKYKEFFHAGDHYQSLSQGFAIGVRPYMSGGFGFICDYGGNDSYIADFFAQGSSYWWSLGMIYDKSGNDLYASYQYAQGAGAHMALGLLLDGGGDDIYRSHGLCHGVGHDYSCGWLLDRGGNDVYSAQGLAQGGGQANGIGIFTDLNGDDGYFTTHTHNTQGYGNPRRDYGSIGLFLDMDGDDRYGANGGNGKFWKVPGKWGGGLDLKKIEVLPSDSTAVDKK
ncbi:MAG: hypothetical protein V3V99_05995 [candidate division Zixibacteria bacterium]